MASQTGLLRVLQVADQISDLELGNGTSVLITANIASALPTSVGAALQQAADKDSSALPIYALAFFLTTLGVVYVQEARIHSPMGSTCYAWHQRGPRSLRLLPLDYNITRVLEALPADLPDEPGCEARRDAQVFVTEAREAPSGLS